MQRMTRTAGYSLIELIIALLVSSLAATIGIPAMQHWAASTRMDLAAAEISSTLQYARLFAIRKQQNVALKFHVEDDGPVTFTLYEDMNHDGVRARDIARKIDRPLTPSRPLAHMGRRVRFGFPEGLEPLKIGSDEKRLERLDDPIRFNRSNMASFSRRGTATPGTIYLTDGVHLLAVRVTSRTGKVTTLHYDPEREIWR